MTETWKASYKVEKILKYMGVSLITKAKIIQSQGTDVTAEQWRKLIGACVVGNQAIQNVML